MEVYGDNLILKEAALKTLKAGVTTKEVFEAVETESIKRNIPFWREAGIGHGIGTNEVEAPYLNSNDSTDLKAGMVLVVAVYTYGKLGELICLKDCYEITETGNRLMSWYKKYDELYSMKGSPARHG